MLAKKEIQGCNVAREATFKNEHGTVLWKEAFVRGFLKHSEKTIARLEKGPSLIEGFDRADNSVPYAKKILNPKYTKVAAFVLALFLIVPVSSKAATYYSRATGNWTTNTTWSTASGGASVGTGVYPVAGDVVIIERGYTVTVNSTSAACASITLGANGTTRTGTLTFATSGSPLLTVSGTVQVGGTINNTSNGIITFVSGSSMTVGTLAMGNTTRTSSSTLTMTSGSTLTINNAITVAGTGTKSWTPSTGTVIMNATNTLPATIFTSFYNLTINSGTTTLAVNLNSITGGSLTVNAGATLALLNYSFGATTPIPTTILYGGATTGSIISGTGTFYLGGGVTVNSSGTGTSGATISCPVALGATRTFTVADDGSTADDLTISGAISGSGYGITKAEAGTMLLSGANTFTGAVTISAGTLKVGASSTVNTSSPTGTTGAITVVSGASLDMNGYSYTSNHTQAISINGTGVSSLGAITNSSSTTSTLIGPITFSTAAKIAGEGGLLAITGTPATGITAITLGGSAGGSVSTVIAGARNLIKDDSGTWTLTGANTYTGTTTITAGELRLNPSANVTPASQFILNGGTLSTTSITASRTITNSSTLMLNASSTLTLGSNTHSLTFANSSGISWTSGATLTITGWSGGYDGTAGTVGRIYVGSSTSGLTSSQLSQIQFYDGTDYYPATILSTGEVVAKKPITTGSLSSSSYCPGSTVSVTFTVSMTFNSGNVFTAQLSDASGSFSSPTAIGTLTSTTSGTITATIPSSQTVGTGYRIRVVSSSPAYVGSDNGSDITIGGPTVTSVSPGSRCGEGEVTVSATASAGTIYWYSTSTGGSSLGSGSTYTSYLTSTTTYYAEVDNGGCTSSSRTEVTAYIITPPTVTASGDGTFCYGDNVSLSCTSDDYDNLYWVGPNSYYSTTEDPTISSVTTSNTGTYTVHTNALSGINLVTNGDFEDGNTDFTSTYTYTTTSTGSYGILSAEAYYTIDNNAHDTHTNFSSCTDHTSGSGLMMVINGAGTANVVIWSQTVNVVPNTYYQFTYWVQSVHATSPSILQLYVNGTAAGPTYTASSTTCNWTEFLYNWSSGSATTAILSLINQNTATDGNDFALDDIVFQHTCTDSASVTIAVNAQVTAGAIGTAQTVCRGTSVTLTSTTAGTGTGTITYEWQSSTNGTTWTTIDGATSATYTANMQTTTYFRRRTVATNVSACYSSYTSSVLITVNGPAVEAGGPNTVCQSSSPSAITLTGASYSGTGTTGATWSITSGGGSLSNIGTTTNPSGVTYTPAANYSGTAILTLTVNGGACAATDTRIINITASPSASAGTAITTCSSTGAVDITTGASASDYASVAWTSSGTGTFANSTSLTGCTYTPSATDISNGSVTLTLTAYGNSPCGDATSTKVLTIVAAATASAGSSVSMCSGDGSTNITTGASATHYSSVAWTSDGTGTLTNATSLTNCTYTPSAADITNGSVTLTLTAYGNSPCENATSTKTLTIITGPTASAGSSFQTCYTSGAISITSGASASNYTSVVWTSSGTGTFTNATSLTTCTYTPSSTDISNGSVTLTLTAISSTSCADATSNKTLTISSLPTASAGGTTTICTGESATVSGASSSNGSILWTHNGSGSLTNTTTLTPTYTPASGDVGKNITLTLTVTGYGGCSSETATATYTVVVSCINAKVEYVSTDECPDVSSSPFDGNNSSYNPGNTTVGYSVTRENSSSSWTMYYTFTVTSSPSISGLSVTNVVAYDQSNNEISPINGDHFDFGASVSSVTIYATIANEPGHIITIELDVYNVTSAGESETNTSDNSATVTIKAMPVVGSFN